MRKLHKKLLAYVVAAMVMASPGTALAQDIAPPADPGVTETAPAAPVAAPSPEAPVAGPAAAPADSAPEAAPVEGEAAPADNAEVVELLARGYR
ncbi:MAG: hypothetical protein V3U85_00210, partial [Hyphomicrobium sp.]